jgi:hypothetical protein
VNDVANVLSVILGFAALWAVLCRINHMQRGKTDALVFWQHCALGLGVAGLLVFPPPWGRLCLAAGLMAFLLAGSYRWRYGAPEGIKR